MQNALLLRLRAETAESHRALEARFNLFENVKTRADYTELLCRYYRLHLLFERELAKLKGVEVATLTLVQRAKTPWLQADLIFLGAHCPECEAEAATALPPLSDMPTLLGSLYVLEGSTLGGQLIVKHFEKLFPQLSRSQGLRYFHGYGDDTRQRWQEFASELEHWSQRLSAAEVSRAADAARRMFRAVEDILCSAPFPSAAARFPTL